MHTNRTTLPTRAAGALALTAALVLAGCGDDVEEGAPVAASAGATASSGTASAADVDFLAGMIPHHRQATEMAALVDGRTEDPDVVALAEQIEAAQQPEIEEMSALLESYGEPVPEGDGTDHGAMGHSDEEMSGGMSGAMDGMMSLEQMAELEGLSGEEFDRAWLTMMVEHHEGAVAMAEEATDEAEQPEVLALADEIATAQEAEIATMEGLLARG